MAIELGNIAPLIVDPPYNNSTPMHSCRSPSPFISTQITWGWYVEVRFAQHVINQTLYLLDQVGIKKSIQHTFENNSNRFRTNFDPFTGVFRLPSENNNESWHKTECCNVLSYIDRGKQRHLAPKLLAQAKCLHKLNVGFTF